MNTTIASEATVASALALIGATSLADTEVGLLQQLLIAIATSP